MLEVPDAAASLQLSPNSIAAPVEREDATAATSSKWKSPLSEDVQKLSPNIARRTNNRDPICHLMSPDFMS